MTLRPSLVPVTVRVILFLVIVSSVLLATALYVTRRGMQTAGIGLEDSGRPRRRVWIAVGLGLFSVLLVPWLTRLSLIGRLGLSEKLAAAGFMVGLAVVFSAALLGPIDVVRWVTRKIARRRGASGSERESGSGSGSERESGSGSGSERESESGTESGSPVVAASTLPRRDFLTRAAYGAALATGVGHAAYAVARGRHDYAIEDLVVRIRDLPPELEGLTIAQISDVHIGTFVGERELSAGLSLLERARPDLIAMTGDLIDHDPHHIDALGRFARRVTDLRPRFGVHAIPGNHDYYTGVDDVLGALSSAGVDVLRNSATEIRDGRASIALLGTDDVWAERDNWGTRYDLTATLAAAPRDVPRILLCHNPERFDVAAPHVDLQLSGHTHGGQVNFVMRPADIALRHGFVAGHYTRGAGQLYVNRGFGTVGPPARLYAPPEITRVTLVRA